MSGFLKATLTRQKFQGLFINTAVGNFAAYVAGSLVTLASTRQVFEQRGIRNLFGLLPRKKIVVHILPHWLEWLLALIVGFLVMEAVRYWFNHRKYAALLIGLRGKRRTATDSQACDQPNAAERCTSDAGGGLREAPPERLRTRVEQLERTIPEAVQSRVGASAATGRELRGQVHEAASLPKRVTYADTETKSVTAQQVGTRLEQLVQYMRDRAERPK